MPWNTVLFKPGVDAVRSAFIADNGWNASNLVRFRSGLPEKNGGWAKMSTTALIGTARGIEAWADLTGIPYLVMGTEQRLQMLALGGVTDITPVDVQSDVSPDFSTVINTPDVTIIDANTPLGLAVGAWVNINIPVSVGGLIVYGLYTVTAIVNSTSYTITAASNATSTVNNGGAVPAYTVHAASTVLTVTLADHGLTTDDQYVNEVATTIGSITVTDYELFFVANVVNSNTFELTLAVAAGGDAGPVSENSGHAQFQYLIPNGNATATLTGGFGVGLFGAGYYGTGTNGVTYTTIRQWFMDQWGEDWVGNYPASPIFIWLPPVALGNRAIAINTTNFGAATSPPATVNVSFVSMPAQILFALGVDPSGGGSQDPNLVRWSDVADYTKWVATATNQAGSFRIPHGSRIVGGITGPLFGLIWTDVDMWIFNYIGFPLVFGFNNLAQIGMIAARCCVQAEGYIYWIANNAMYRFDGSSPSIVPCPVWDILWQNLDRTQIDKCFMSANAWFNEVALFFPSTAGAGEVDSYIRYNYRENVWDYGFSGTAYACTCWADENVFGPPISVDLNKLIQQHEIAFDADGAQMMEYIMSDYFNLDTGWLLTAIDQVVTDFKFLGTNAQVLYWIYVVDYPTDAPTINGPYTATLTAPQFSQINVQGRMAAIRIGLSSVGSWWRLGYTRYLFSPNGTI